MEKGFHNGVLTRMVFMAHTLPESVTQEQPMKLLCCY